MTSPSLDLSRRGLLRLSLGGAAAMAAAPGLTLAATPRQAAPDGLARATPESQGIASAAIL
ncbi:MAG: hypothetical protein RR698_17750, partial [Stenotrophomonas sp.]